MSLDDRTRRLLVDVGIGLLIVVMIAAAVVLGAGVAPLFIYQAF